MRIHLGHHFYGAGNLGDDFMLAGFLAALKRLAPEASYSCCVPFPLAPLQARFPAVGWLPYEPGARERCIRECDVWLGLGGSPFQSAQSRWFIDHLLGDAHTCARERKPQFFLGVGVQNALEAGVPEVQQLCQTAAHIWTRDAASTDRIAQAAPSARVTTGADLAHVFFRAAPPPPAERGRVTLVANFDYGSWPAQAAMLRAVERFASSDRVWLAQESRELPGAERALFAALSPAARSRWRLVVPDDPAAGLHDVLTRWPSGEWLVTSRYHAALAGAWSGSKVVVIATNEKLRAAARDLGAPQLAPDADDAATNSALQNLAPCSSPQALAEKAEAACAAFVRSAVAHRR